MANTWVTTGIGVALLVFVSLFVGIGFSAGALTVGGQAASCSAGQSCYSFNDYLEGQNQAFGAGLTVTVNITNVQESGLPPVTAMLAGYQSTDVSFTTNVFSNGDCGNSAQPVWAPGTGADYGFYTIQYTTPNGAIPFSGTLDGQPVTTGDGTVLGPWNSNNVLDENGTGFMAYCVTDPVSGAQHHTSSAGISTPAFAHTLTLTGLYPNGVITVSMNLEMTKCTGSFLSASAPTVCSRVAGLLGMFNYDGPNGGLTYSASASTNVWSAGSSITVLNAQSVYNGGTIQVGVTTGYDGPNGYQLEVLCPAPRSCGGQPDSAFPAQTIQNEILTPETVSIPVPKGFSVNSSVQGWNTVTVALVANYGVAAQTLPFAVDISPLYKPSMPYIGHSISSGAIYPSIGDTVDITVYANASAQSTQVQTVELALFYTVPGQSATSAPGCGSYWITSCPYSSISTVVTNNGTNGIATFSFVVQPPIGATAIAGDAVSESATQQGTNSSFFYLPLAPVNCAKGTACNPSQSGLSLWEAVGPALFIGIIALVVAFILSFMGVDVWYRYGIPIALAVVLSLLYYIIQAAMFVPGAIFGGPVG